MGTHAFGAVLSDPRAVFTALFLVFSLAAFVPYIRNTLRRRTQPHRASWLVWSVLGSIAFFTNLHNGASLSLWFIAAQVGPTLVVCALSVRLGHGDYFSTSNKLIFTGSAGGLALWALLDSPVYALVVTILISAIGAIPTVIKAFQSPQSETLHTWILCLLSGLFALLSLQDATLFELAYPLYLFALYTAIVTANLLGRRSPSKAVTAPMGPKHFAFDPTNRYPKQTNTPRIQDDAPLPLHPDARASRMDRL